jgi:hypothetical protein
MVLMDKYYQQTVEVYGHLLTWQVKMLISVNHKPLHARVDTIQVPIVHVYRTRLQQ